MKLEGSRVLITGASGDLGRALLQAFHGAGARVAGVSRTRDMTKFCELHWKLDLRNEACLEKMFAELEQQWFGVDILINNAGEAFDALLLKSSKEDWQRLAEIHLFAPGACARLVLPGMMRQRQGAILNISSLAARRALPGQTVYAGVKAGLEGLTRSLAREVGGKNIRVNAIAPGFVEGSWTAKFGEEGIRKFLGHVPLKRLAKPEEVASLALFLASPQASYITGQIVGIDGGAGI